MQFNIPLRLSLGVVSMLGLAAGAAAQAVLPESPRIEPVIDAAQRALPTRTTNVLERAHYQHVYIDKSASNSGSLQTISLEDAVNSNVLASSPLQAKPLDHIDPQSLTWIVLDRGFARPSSLEGAGGAGLTTTTFAEVNFALNETVILQPERLKTLTDLAQRIGGIFYVVAYADESGLEASNKTLSEERAKSVAEALTAAGVNASRVKATGAGISRIYQGLDANRRASITFRVVE